MTHKFFRITDIFPALAPPRVIIVEDDPTILEALSVTCPIFGVEVVGTAATTADALALVHVHAPDIALVDIRLADHQTGGLEVARGCRRSGTDVIFMTSWFNSLDILRGAVSARPVMILNKPVSARSLYLAILASVGRRL